MRRYHCRHHGNAVGILAADMMNTTNERKVIKHAELWLLTELLYRPEITHIHQAIASDITDEHSPRWLYMISDADPAELEHARIAALHEYSCYIRDRIIPKFQEELGHDYHSPFVS
jgi:hypothetical protein